MPLKRRYAQGRYPAGVVLEIAGDLVLLCTAAIGFDAIALAEASGVTHPPGSLPGTLEVEFIHSGWWVASLLLCVPLFFFTRRWRSAALGLLAAGLVTAPQFWATSVNLARWESSAQGDGLEHLAILIPWVFLACFVVAALLGRMAATFWPPPMDASAPDRVIAPADSTGAAVR